VFQAEGQDNVRRTDGEWNRQLSTGKEIERASCG
jgi:hypothetical protein